AQLEQSPSVAARVRAAQHFGQTRQPEDRELLAKALTTEKYWGVQNEIAQALGDSGGDTCRDGLLQGMKEPNARVRRGRVSQLGKFIRDAKVAAAVKEVLQKGDASYGVEAAALRAYAALQQPDAVAVLLPWLAKPSHNETLRTAALGALGETRDLSALDTLLTWMKKGKPRECRSAALSSLGKLAQTANPSAEQRQQIVTATAARL